MKTDSESGKQRIPYCRRISTHGLSDFENFIKENYPNYYWPNRFSKLVKGGICTPQDLERLEISPRLRINGIRDKYLPVLKEIQKLIPEYYNWQSPTSSKSGEDLLSPAA